MRSYFSVLKWVSNKDYDPNEEDIKNALVYILDSGYNQDFKIGERVIPNYELFYKLHTACVDYIHSENNAFNPAENLDVRMEYVFDCYEKVDNKTYLERIFTNDPECLIPDYLDAEGYVMESYKEYKNEYIDTIITEKTQQNNIQFFFLANIRIEVIDIIYDFIDYRKIYVLGMKKLKK